MRLNWDITGFLERCQTHLDSTLWTLHKWEKQITIYYLWIWNFVYVVLTIFFCCYCPKRALERRIILIQVDHVLVSQINQITTAISHQPQMLAMQCILGKVNYSIHLPRWDKWDPSLSLHWAQICCLRQDQQFSSQMKPCMQFYFLFMTRKFIWAIFRHW